MSNPEIVLRVSTAEAGAIARQWSELCDEHGLGSEYELPPGITVEGFSGAEVVEMVVPAAQALTPVVTALIGYLAARRTCDIEYSDGEQTYKFRNLTPEKAERFLALFREGTTSEDDR